MNPKDFSINVNNNSIGVAPNSSFLGVVSSGINEPAATTGTAANEVYGNIPERPLQDAVEGIKFDFNDGIRVAVPPGNREYRICFSDMDTGVFLYNNVVQPGGMVTSVKKFFIRFKLEIFRKNENTPIFVHEYDATNKQVMIQLPVSTLGDPLGWFPYVEKFRVKNNCKVIAVMTDSMIQLLSKMYPEITFITKNDTMKYRTYACYYLGLFFRGNTSNQPSDFRYVGLHRTAGYILGVDPSEERPRFDLSAPRRIKEPYVCIGVQSSNQAKYWNNPNGWLEVVKLLHSAGYRVLCMDREPVYGWGINYNHMPAGTEDFTGSLPLQERVDIIKDCDFFIGLSSGLSWLAWGCKVPVVMISGLTHPLNEFNTPYRVINYHTCNSCWNDMRVDFDHYDFLWCPRHKGTDRHYECTKMISPFQVSEMVKRVPQFQAQLESHQKELAASQPQAAAAKEAKPVNNKKK